MPIDDALTELHEMFGGADPVDVRELAQQNASAVYARRRREV